MDDQLLYEYEAKLPDLRRLVKNCHTAIDEALTAAGIDVFAVSSRVKSYASLVQKIGRKQVSDPFSSITDLCGLRIVVRYPGDLAAVDHQLRASFIIHSQTDKADELGSDRFGYRSHHYVVSVNEDLLTQSRFEGLGAYNFEIQVRTILMHAWASVSHHLFYKYEEDATAAFKRHIFQLSALFEMADEQLERVRLEKEEQQSEIVLTARQPGRSFDTSAPLSIDSLQAFLSFAYPDRYRSVGGAIELLGEMQAAGVSLDSLSQAIVATEGQLELNEQAELGSPKHRWSQPQIARHALLVINDEYSKLRSRKGISPELTARAAAVRRRLVGVDVVPSGEDTKPPSKLKIPRRKSSHKEQRRSLARFAYERVFLKVVSGQRLMIDDALYEPTGMRGWDRVVFLCQGDRSERVLTVDELVKKLDDWV